MWGGGRRCQPDFDGSLELKNNVFTLKCRESFADVSAKFGIRRPYVTLQREAGASPLSLKLWSAEKYRALIESLRQHFPMYQLVIIGLNRGFELPFKNEYIRDLRAQTSFAELMSIVQNAFLHIGGEGIIPHMRYYLQGGKSVVLFGPSCARRYNYSGNIPLFGTECPNGCEGLMQTWQTTCLKGYAYCRSLEEIQVDDVLEACTKAGLQ